MNEATNLVEAFLLRGLEKCVDGPTVIENVRFGTDHRGNVVIPDRKIDPVSPPPRRKGNRGGGGRKTRR